MWILQVDSPGGFSRGILKGDSPGGFPQERPKSAEVPVAVSTHSASADHGAAPSGHAVMFLLNWRAPQNMRLVSAALLGCHAARDWSNAEGGPDEGPRISNVV